MAIDAELLGRPLAKVSIGDLVADDLDHCAISVPVASQVFTLGYFVGLFGFPFVAARAIALSGLGSVLGVLMAVVAVNLGFAAVLVIAA